MCYIKGRVYIAPTELVRPLAGVLYAKDTLVKMKEIKTNHFNIMDTEDEELVELQGFTLGTKIAGKDYPIFKVNRQMFDPTSVTCAILNPGGIYGDFLDFFNASKAGTYPKQFVPEYSKVLSMVNLSRKTDIVSTPMTPESESDSESLAGEDEDEEVFDPDTFDYEVFGDLELGGIDRDDVFGDYDQFEDIPELENYTWGYKKPVRARYIEKYNELCKLYTRRIYSHIKPHSFNHLPPWLAYFFWNCVEDCSTGLLQAKQDKMVIFGGGDMSESERIAIWNSITVKTSIFGFIKSSVGTEVDLSNFTILKDFLVKTKIYRIEIFHNYMKNRDRILDELGIVGAKFKEHEAEEV